MNPDDPRHGTQEQAQAQRWIEFGKKMYEQVNELNEALTKIMYVKDEK